MIGAPRPGSPRASYTTQRLQGRCKAAARPRFTHEVYKGAILAAFSSCTPAVGHNNEAVGRYFICSLLAVSAFCLPDATRHPLECAQALLSRFVRNCVVGHIHGQHNTLWRRRH
jgi:hypothetical protein